jgi:aminoglycoside 6'-N-acetyltransferase I
MIPIITLTTAFGLKDGNVGVMKGVIWRIFPEVQISDLSHLIELAENWAHQQGLWEMASDCFLNNEVSLRAHLALGYEEGDRLVHFRKKLE